MIVRYTETKEIKPVKRVKFSEDGEHVLVYNYEQVTPVRIIPLSDFVDCFDEGAQK